MRVLRIAVLLMLVSAGVRGDDGPAKGRTSDRDHDFPIVEEYDRFDKVTQTKLSFERVVSEGPNTLDLSVIRDSPGKTRSPGPVSLYFANVGKDGWKYLEYHTVTILADEERWVYREGYTASVEKDFLFETVFAKLTQERFDRLVGCKSLEIKIGSTVVPLGEEHRRALRDFASRLAAPNPPTDAKRPE